MGLKKLLTVAALLVAGGLTHSAWGQWEPIQPEDVTAKYLTNADFEGEYSVHTSPNKDRAIHAPEGWTVDYKNGKQYDSSMMDTENTSYPTYNDLKTIFNAGKELIGNQTYAVRLHNAGNSQCVTLSQDLGVLPAGEYTLTANFYTQNQNEIEVGFYHTEYNDENRLKFKKENAKWQDLSYTFISDGESQTTIGVFFKHTSKNHMIAAADNVKLSFISDLDLAKNALSETIASVESLNTEINVGDDVFQIPSSAVTALTEAVGTAISARDADDATKESVENANSALLEAIEIYNNVELNAPAENTRYYIKVSSEGSKNLGNAIVASLGSLSANNPTGYSFSANAIPSKNYAQAFIFTKVEGNNYNISIETAEGIVYLTYGSLNGSAASWNKSQIQGTTVAENKGEFRIEASNIEGSFKIFNTVDNQYIDCQDGASIYTDNAVTFEDFTLEVAQKASVNVNIAVGKYATRIFPFAVAAEDIPAGITVKSLSEVNGEKLILNDETAIAPNVPYILYSEEGIETTLTGYGTAKQDTYETDFLTGVYGEGTVPVGSYVLQTQGGVQGFYKVVDEPVAYVPYRAYLTVPSANAKAFFFGGDVTSINGVEGAEGATEVVRYNAAGVKVDAPVKGLNIVKMSDGTVKKVMVK